MLRLASFPSLALPGESPLLFGCCSGLLLALFLSLGGGILPGFFRCLLVGNELLFRFGDCLVDGGLDLSGIFFGSRFLRTACHHCDRCQGQYSGKNIGEPLVYRDIQLNLH